MKIGNVNFKNNIFLAPMAGVTDVAFRSLCKHFGAGVCYTEMVNAKGLIYGEEKMQKLAKDIENFSENPIFFQKNILNESFLKENLYFLKNKTATLLLTEDNECPKIVQIFGNDPQIMAKACQHKLLEKFDIIDINMGCPAPKIVKNGEGSKLMINFELAEKIIIACKSATNKPITVKFRKGFKTDIAVEFAKMCERAGADAITIHGRLATEMYSGTVDYNVIKAVKKAVKIPVVGSGDIKDIATLNKMLETGVDGVMIGRGALGKPYIFEQLTSKKVISKNEEYNLKVWCASQHISILRKYFKEEFLVKYMRKHMLWYASGSNKKELKMQLALSDSLDKSIDLLKEILTN